MKALRAVPGVSLLCLAMALPVAAGAEPASAPAAVRAEPEPASAPAAARAAPAARAPIPFKQDKQGAASLAYQSMAGLVLAGLAAYGAVFGLKRYTLKGGAPLRAGRRLRILESMRLSRHSTLHVVSWRGEELLLADSAQGLRLLGSRDQAAAAAATQGGEHG